MVLEDIFTHIHEHAPERSNGSVAGPLCRSLNLRNIKLSGRLENYDSLPFVHGQARQ